MNEDDSGTVLFVLFYLGIILWFLYIILIDPSAASGAWHAWDSTEGCLPSYP